MPLLGVDDVSGDVNTVHDGLLCCDDYHEVINCTFICGEFGHVPGLSRCMPLDMCLSEDAAIIRLQFFTR